MEISGEVIAYGRVSTEEQSEDEGALVKQLRRLREVGATRIFYDIAQRTNDKRPGINDAIAYIESKPTGSIDKLLFTRLDRLSASPVLFYQLVEVCRKKRVIMVALDDSFDVSTVGGEFSADVRVAIAKHEVKMISLRVRKDLEIRARSNKPHYFAPFGYKVSPPNYDRYEKDTTPIICLLDGKRELTVFDVARLRIDVFFDQGTVRACAKKLNEIFGVSRKNPVIQDKGEQNTSVTDEEISNDLWQNKQSAMVFGNRLSVTSTGLQTWLTNPVLAGGVARGVTQSKEGKKHPSPRSQWDITWHVHDSEAVMTLEERDRILEMFARNARNRWVSDSDKVCSIFSGLIRCGQCGASCSVQGTKFRKRINRTISYFQCNYYRNNGLCSNKTMISDIEVEAQLIPQIVAQAEKLAALGEECDSVLTDSQQVIELRRQLSVLETIAGNNPAIIKAKEDIQEQIANEIGKNSNQRRQSIISRERIIAGFSNPQFWASIDNTADKKRLISSVVAFIRVDAKKILEIKYRH